MTSIWDDPEIRAGGDFFKFDNPGDSISGTITGLRGTRFDDGRLAPQLLITTDSGEERTVTAGQIQLKRKLAELRPEAGDHISITLTHIEQRSGGKSLKHFDVKVNANGAPQQAAVQQTVAAASPAATVSPEAQAAVAKLTPAERAALGL